MNLIFQIIQINFFFILFCLLHSFTASIYFKNLFKKNFEYLLPFYRIFYNLFSLLSFALFWLFSPKPDIIIFDLTFPFDLIFLFIQILAVLALIYSFKYIDLKEFIGLSQIQRFFRNEYNETLDEKYSLITEGPYKYSRHPIYLFSIIFLVFNPVYTLFYLNFVILSIIYFYIGSIFEEKRMEQLFGDEYLSYKKNVPRIFPYFRVKNA